MFKFAIRVILELVTLGHCDIELLPLSILYVILPIDTHAGLRVKVHLGSILWEISIITDRFEHVT